MSPILTDKALRVHTLTVVPEADASQSQSVSVGIQDTQALADRFTAGESTALLKGAVDLWKTEIDKQVLGQRGLALHELRISSNRHLPTLDRIEPEYAHLTTTDGAQTHTQHRPLYSAYAGHSVQQEFAEGTMRLDIQAGGHSKHYDRRQGKFSSYDQFLEKASFFPKQTSSFANAESITLVLVPHFEQDGVRRERKDDTVALTLTRQPDGRFEVGEQGRFLAASVNGPVQFGTFHSAVQSTVVGFRAAIVANDGVALDNNNGAGFIVAVPDIEPKAP
jgi:hypothetical protein